MGTPSRESTENAPRIQRKRTAKPTTFSRLLAKVSLEELQDAFADFLSQLLQETPLTAAIDGKTSKHILDEDGEVLQMDFT